MPDCESCVYAQRIEALEKSADKNSGAHEKIYERLNAIERDNCATEVQYGQIMKSLDEIKGDVSELKQRPVKRFDAIQMALISSFISVIVGLAIKFLGG